MTGVQTCALPISADFLERGRTVSVNLAPPPEIVATIAMVDSAKVLAFMGDPNLASRSSEPIDRLPCLYRHKGALYVHNGHHRAIDRKSVEAGKGVEPEGTA